MFLMHSLSTISGPKNKSTSLYLYPIRTLDSIAFLLAATHYQGIPDRNHKHMYTVK